MRALRDDVSLRDEVSLVTAVLDAGPQVHELIFRDSFFRCACSKIHPVKDIDDARDAQRVHESQVTSQSALDESEPSELAEIRGRKDAATNGPFEWLGTSLESRGESVLEVSVSCSSYCYGGSPVTEISEADRAFLEKAQVDVSVAVAGLDAVIGLHGPQVRHSGGVQRRICAECSKGLPGQGSNSIVLWPCRTFVALRDGMKGELKAILEYDPYAS